MSQLSAAKVIATTGVKLPVFTTATRPSLLSTDAGLLIYNSTDDVVQAWSGSEWITVGGGSYGRDIIVTPYGGSATTYTLSTTTATNFTTQGFYTVTAAKKVKIKVRLWGAGGGGSASSAPARGSGGGYTEGILDLAAGTYCFIVGQGGRGGGYGYVTGSAAGGFPDGGIGSTAPYLGYAVAGAGGGSSRFGGNITYANINSSSNVYYLIAGGGGGGCDYGAGYSYSGTDGGGGGLSGAKGSFYYPSGESLASTGGGGTQSAGGAGGTGGRLANGNAGSKYAGGSGTGGGGGGGYYGGGGAAGYYACGGGGSGYIDSTVTNGVFATGRDGTSSQYFMAYATNAPSATTGYGGLNAASATNHGFDGAVQILSMV
jgi:Glycine rich protein